MSKIETLINLLDKKYGNKTITEGSKDKIREIVKQEIGRVIESLKEVDDSDSPMTFESFRKVVERK